MLIYICSPFNHEDQKVVEQRVQEVKDFMVALLEEGFTAISPIVIQYSFLEEYGLPTTWDFWKNFCTTLMNKADKAIVLCIPGWDISEGVKAEIAYFEQLGIPIEYVH